MLILVQLPAAKRSILAIIMIYNSRRKNKLKNRLDEDNYIDIKRTLRLHCTSFRVGCGGGCYSFLTHHILYSFHFCNMVGHPNFLMVSLGEVSQSSLYTNCDLIKNVQAPKRMAIFEFISHS